MATIKKVKKAQKGMTMKELKMKYPDADTTAKGDVRGTEINAYAPKKVLKKYNDTYNAFDRKFKGGPAKNKMGGVTKAKNGKSFPDLNKDGKITQKDILIGKGVLPKTAKKGGTMKKSMSMGGKMNMGGMMKKGGKMTKTCKYGCK
jgi:hypothetical protein